jgi:hypothetical protein
MIVLATQAGPVTYVLIALLAVFGLLDLFAHLTKGKYGETFSMFDKHAERTHTVLKLVNIAVLAVLFVHLALDLV